MVKNFFSAHKKYGSKDRKQISHLCYCYFRTGKMFFAAATNTLETNIITALFLCTTEHNEMLSAMAPELETFAPLPIDEKTALLQQHALIPAGDPYELIFPWKSFLSDGTAFRHFALSFFTQPDLFIRIRPGYREKVMKVLKASGIPCYTLGNDGIGLPNHTKADEMFAMNKEVVVQDYSSQRVQELLFPLQQQQQLQVWDCCAASGGKSILAKDCLGDIALTVSDIRGSMLANLRSRFKQAGISRYKAFVADLTRPGTGADPAGYDLVICDAPCSGSGTWARTPEQLYYWRENKLGHYTALQKKITTTVVPFIKPGGHLLYITCSVFKNENEDIVNGILQQFNLELLQMKVISGYDIKADTMFAALLRKLK
jgi:16S rRNA (cytosine967-C5)-methyltransferase